MVANNYRTPEPVCNKSHFVSLFDSFCCVYNFFSYYCLMGITWEVIERLTNVNHWWNSIVNSRGLDVGLTLDTG